MVRILFVCLGNICRSPMAEFVLKEMVHRQGKDAAFFIASAATSTEETGHGVHPGTRAKLAKEGVPCGAHTAVQMTAADYAAYDYLLGMDSANIRNMQRIAGGDAEHKISRLLAFTAHPRDIADPWYTGNFAATYEDIVEGCTALLAHLAAQSGF